MKKRIDDKFWRLFGHCFDCQINFEHKLRLEVKYDKIAKDIVVVEFWAEWNKANEFAELNKLKDSSVYRVDIMHCSKLQADYKISAVPTVVVFDNGVEKERFNANIMFQLEADKKTIQTSIDTIILNKFQ